ncbi:MAG: hypothetical protein ABSA47_06930 [Verrucomicrobiota bacterium]|jgi:hypothetical protein
MNTQEGIAATTPSRHGLPAGKILPLLLAAGMLAGCARRYDMLLTNQRVVSNVRKPKLSPDHSYYIIVDRQGRTNTIPAGEVNVIQPHQKSPLTAPQ